MMIPINFEKIACSRNRFSRKSIVKDVKEKDEPVSDEVCFIEIGVTLAT